MNVEIMMWHVICIKSCESLGKVLKFIGMKRGKVLECYQLERVQILIYYKKTYNSVLLHIFLLNACFYLVHSGFTIVCPKNRFVLFPGFSF